MLLCFFYFVIEYYRPLVDEQNSVSDSEE